jgi:hypothetical protein
MEEGPSRQVERPAHAPWLIQKSFRRATFHTRVAWYKPTYDVMGPIATMRASHPTIVMIFLVFEQIWVPFAYSIVTLFIVLHEKSHPEFLHILPQNYFPNLTQGHQ